LVRITTPVMFSPLVVSPFVFPPLMFPPLATEYMFSFTIPFRWVITVDGFTTSSTSDYDANNLFAKVVRLPQSSAPITLGSNAPLNAGRIKHEFAFLMTPSFKAF
jgi:hypothetical protein